MSNYVRSSNDKKFKEVPEVISDKSKSRLFKRGKFLGKGGFARCYELLDEKTKAVVAGKVVSKVLLQKQYQKDKMVQEITIHRLLNHPHVVKLNDYFEDNDNVYIILELCSRRSLMELHKRRRGVTEPEAKYYTYQVVDALVYLHEKNVIHRDLKLGNLFINNDMQLKIGDFGLATIVEHEGERKKTLCGTPNYIAPEVLDKKGHSFEVDVWAVGCILYTLIAGKPPFETKELKDTYERIKRNEYKIPCWMSRDAATLVRALLSAEPSKRPLINTVLSFDFFKKGYMPSRLPTSCLTMSPKYTTEQINDVSKDIVFRAITKKTSSTQPEIFKGQTTTTGINPPLRRCDCCPHPSLALTAKATGKKMAPLVASRPDFIEMGPRGDVPEARPLQNVVQNANNLPSSDLNPKKTTQACGRTPCPGWSSRLRAPFLGIPRDPSAAKVYERFLGFLEIAYDSHHLPVWNSQVLMTHSQSFYVAFRSLLKEYEAFVLRP